MRLLNVPAGARVLLGAPAKPMPLALSNAIADLVLGIAGVQEAYLPQCFVTDAMEAPAQVLVLVLDGSANRQRVLEQVGEGLARVLPPGMYVDIWPMAGGSELLTAVRGTRTHVHCQPPPAKKPWWKIFG
jgi:hypothetical protein